MPTPVEPDSPADAPEPTSEGRLVAPSAADTAVLSLHEIQQFEATMDAQSQQDRRFTAPGFDAKETQAIESGTPPEPATDEFEPVTAPTLPRATFSLKSAFPRSIPPKGGTKSGGHRINIRWGWVVAIAAGVLVMALLATLGTLVLTRHHRAGMSQQDRVRSTIESYDAAIQNGDLMKLRSITCGTTLDGYAGIDESAWIDTYRRVAAAKQYPVIASIDQVVVNGSHAEANVTAFVAYDPSVRSTRSFDLQFLDNQWKICQAPAN